MRFQFDPAGGLIRIEAEIVGPIATANVLLALDSGASQTMIRNTVLASIGCDPSKSTHSVQVITASGVESSPLATVMKLQALGKSLAPFTVIAHTFPPSSSIDGLLGIDFLRGGKLTIDFLDRSIDFE